MVYKHAYLKTLLSLHSALRGEDAAKRRGGGVGGCALNSHGNYIVDHGKIMELRF